MQNISKFPTLNQQAVLERNHWWHLLHLTHTIVLIAINIAIHWLGIGTDNLVTVETDENGCMSVDKLIKKIDDVIKSNRQPFFVNATAGTTVLGAFDDLKTIADICKKYNLWMHIDVSKYFTQIVSKN